MLDVKPSASKMMRCYHRAILLLAVLEQIVVHRARAVMITVMLFPMPSFPSACHDRDTEGGGGNSSSAGGGGGGGSSGRGVEGCGRLAEKGEKGQRSRAGQLERGDLERPHPELSIGWVIKKA